jgi:hypothetical protein
MPVMYVPMNVGQNVHQHWMRDDSDGQCSKGYVVPQQGIKVYHYQQTHPLCLHVANLLQYSL